MKLRSLVALLLLAALPAGAARQHRSHRAILSFKRSHPCPSTGQRTGRCPGYVIDHIRPLVCGGEDAPANMQWQTMAEAKAKDKWERHCSLRP
jgi:hypothetical protein